MLSPALPAGTVDPLDELIDRVATGIAEMGVPEDQSLVGQVAVAVTDMGCLCPAPRPNR